MDDLMNDPTAQLQPMTIEDELKIALMIKRLLAAKVPMKEILDNLGKGAYSDENKRIDTAMGMMWADSGFPILKVSPKWAAAAMTTNVPKDVADGLKSPWEGFILELPRNEDLLFVSIYGKQYPVSHIKVAHLPGLTKKKENAASGDWAITIASRTTAYVLRSTAVSLHIPDDLTLVDDHSSKAGILAGRLAGRLVASALCAMQTPKNLQRVGASSSKTKNPHTGKEPIVYQITEPVTIDLTEHVRQYQLGAPGKGKKLELQLVVCGHRKNQPYGPKHSLRKPIWIEPYIRGPETAPMALRAHILKTE